MIDLEYDGIVAVITLHRGVTNAFNLEMARSLGEILAQLKDDMSTRALVVTSANDKFFCIGFDIPELIRLDREGMRTFYRTFNQTTLELYMSPKPTVAAITGHATAGGCILTTCCDYRFIATGRKLMGLNEVKLGVPVPFLADRILHQLLGTRGARDVMDSGEFYPPEDLKKLGLVDELLPLEEVRSRAREKARSLGGLPPPALSMIKKNRVERLVALIHERRGEKEEYFLDCWFSPETRTRLEEAAGRF